MGGGTTAHGVVNVNIKDHTKESKESDSRTTTFPESETESQCCPPTKTYDLFLLIVLFLAETYR